MKKKMMLLIAMIQIVALSACGKEANITPMETDIPQTEQSESTPENIAAAGEGEQDREEGGMTESLKLTEEDQMPENSSDTVAGAKADPQNQQTLYLWEENNMPAITEYTENNGYYTDDPDFRPYIVTFPVPEGTEVKGAVLICAGGAFQYRSDQNEGTPVAQALSESGYQSFVVNYRLRPYTQEEGALDLARAVRFVRQNADVYGILSHGKRIFNREIRKGGTI